MHTNHLFVGIHVFCPMTFPLLFVSFPSQHNTATLSTKKKKLYYFLTRVPSRNRTLWGTMGEKLCSTVRSPESDSTQGYLVQRGQRGGRRKADARGKVQKDRQNNSEVHARKIKQKVRGWKDDNQKAWCKRVQDPTKEPQSCLMWSGKEWLMT